MDPEEANKFINSLVKNLQVLCHGHVSFSNSIQVIGHLYLNVDSNVNIDYIVNEKVCKNDTSSTVFVSNSYHSEPHKKIPHDNGQNQNKNRPAEDLEASVDLTDDGTVVQRLLPINFRSNASNTPSAIHPAYRDQGSTHHSRKSRRPFHNIEASQAKSPRMSLASSPRSVNRNDSNIKEEKHSMNLNSSQLQENVRMENSQLNDFANSNVPEAAEMSATDNNTSSSLQNKNQDGSPFELSLQNIKNEPGEEMGQNSLYEQQLESNSSQPIQHSDASADEEFFSGLRDKTLGVFPVALHASDQVLGSDNFSGLSQPSTSSFKDEMGDLDPGSGASHLDSTLNDLITTDASGYYNDQVYIPGTSFPRRRQYFDNKERNKICTATTVNLSEIGESDRFVQMKSYKCKQCHYTSNKFYNLRRHVLTKHDMNNVLVCQICGRSCGDNFQLRMHTENVHGTGEKKFECPFSHCPKRFSWKCGLQSHIKKCPFRESER